jgi:hypothetical protein
MEVFNKPILFKIHLWLQPIGRAIVLLSLIPILLGILYKADKYIYMAFILFFSGSLLTWIAFFIGLTFKCTACGKRPSVILFKVSEAKYIDKPKDEIEAIINDFYPIEIRKNKFKCIYCGAEYSLNKES